MNSAVSSAAAEWTTWNVSVQVYASAYGCDFVGYTTTSCVNAISGCGGNWIGCQEPWTFCYAGSPCNEPTTHLYASRLVFRDTLNTGAYTQPVRQAVACWEIGHSLGLDHRSSGVSCMDSPLYLAV